MKKKCMTVLTVLLLLNTAMAQTRVAISMNDLSTARTVAVASDVMAELQAEGFEVEIRDAGMSLSQQTEDISGTCRRGAGISDYRAGKVDWAARCHSRRRCAGDQGYYDRPPDHRRARPRMCLPTSAWTRSGQDGNARIFWRSILTAATQRCSSFKERPLPGALIILQRAFGTPCAPMRTCRSARCCMAKTTARYRNRSCSNISRNPKWREREGVSTRYSARGRGSAGRDQRLSVHTRYGRRAGADRVHRRRGTTP